MAEHKCTTAQTDLSKLSSLAPEFDTTKLHTKDLVNTSGSSTDMSQGRSDDSNASTPSFQMSPAAGHESPASVASSSGTGCMGCRLPSPVSSEDEASCPSLSNPRSQDGSLAKSTKSILSVDTEAHFRELDERLPCLVLEEEATTKNIPADQTTTAPLTAMEKQGAPFAFECAFGCSGDLQELEATPKSKEGFVTKLKEAKTTCESVQLTLVQYQIKINTRGHHSFSKDFLKQHNKAVSITYHQLCQIDEKLDEMMAEVHAVSGETDGQALRDQLTTAYEHALSWILRAKRVMYANHVWYKLNYTLSAHTKPPTSSCKTESAMPTILGH